MPLTGPLRGLVWVSLLPLSGGFSLFLGRPCRPLSNVPSVSFFFPWLQDYYSGGYYPAQDPALVPPQEMASDASFIDDEAVS